MANGFSGRKTEAEAMARFWEEKRERRERLERMEEREALRQETTLEEATQKFEETKSRWLKGEATNEEMGETARQKRLLEECK